MANYNCIFKTIVDTEGDLWDVFVTPEAAEAGPMIFVTLKDHTESYDFSKQERQYAACQCEEVVDYLDDLFFSKEYWLLERGSETRFTNGRTCAEYNDFFCSYLQDVETSELFPIKEALFDGDGYLRNYVVLMVKDNIFVPTLEPTVLPDTDYAVSKYGAELIANVLEYAIHQAKDSCGEINPFSDDAGFPVDVLEDAEDAEQLVGYFHDLANHDGALLVKADWYKTKEDKQANEDTARMIYPCDVDAFGECPKHCQDCEHCVGWFEADFEESTED